ncbi:hypothetical protein [Micavibrio aeruginosavorus]|uniref:Uncharacterized protein n=1 Tax=Micavibrio aeruginosavorus (strain ARL-13) TaxID=856793 RepID=G2KRP8_MICAA|nr:hypothetical protein [Micavibrio aeruginosavorus]AEP10006.1 hypothetical protein MICA_1693 [Micavibrio aeruginosavorus ARL-13]
MGSAYDESLTARFNRLSFWGRNSLRSAALAESLSGMVRDGTKKRPWLYPFFMTYLICLTTPLPVPGGSTVLVALTGLYAAIPALPGSKALRSSFAAAVRPPVLVENYTDFIRPSADRSQADSVRALALGWRVTCRGAADMWQSTRFALAALRAV